MSDFPILQPVHSPGPWSEDATAACFHERLLDSLYDGVYFVDVERKITYWNHGAEQLTGFDRHEVVGRYCYENFLMHVNDEGCFLCLNGCPLAATLADGKRREVEVYLRHKLGHRVPVSVRVGPLFDQQGRIVGAVEIFTDISAKKNIERRAGELEGLAYRDPLTGLPNRRYFMMKIEQAIQEVAEFKRHVGLLMIDLDGFKRVNDTYGHEAGDLVLKTVCATLAHNLRPGDIAARWGGEEFLVLVMDVDSNSLMRFAERCRRLIADSAVPFAGSYVQVTASVGATLLEREDAAASATHRADQLMYKSKASGGNRTTLG